MKNVLAQESKKVELFLYILFLTSIFLMMEISFFIACNKLYFADFISVEDIPHIPISILPGIIYFIFAELILHLLLCVIVWAWAFLVTNSFLYFKKNVLYTAIIVWGLAVINILMANQTYFPNSKFSDLTSSLFLPQYLIYFQIIFIFFNLILISLASIGIVRLASNNKKFLYLLASLLMISGGFMLFPFKATATFHKATFKQPNIIIIGVDSLRPDFLSYFGADQPTPFVDSFLKTATVFSESVTPIARTFPSWISLLSGQYPRKNSIRTNLAPQNKINLAEMLPVILQKNNYETAYASDETRFSNMTKDLGFEQIITPPMGLNDFIIGTFNDLPLSNLLVNTPVGQYVFPFNYANRPADYTYQPDSFLKLLSPLLNQQRTKPLFLAVHFCLPHFPYLWADMAATDFNLRERYAASIKRVDQQLKDFFVLLDHAHLLDHAIVVLLSDHGEALELPGDRITEKELFYSLTEAVPQFYPPSLDKEAINQSAGHGTDVLGLPQYHTLLAFKLYGMAVQPPANLPGTVSLLDIKPTLLQLLNIRAAQMDGRSLVSTILTGRQPLLPNRHIFLESDFTPEAIRTIYPETRHVMLEGIQFFQIDPVSLHLTVKEGMQKMIVNSKQYADIYGEWMLALYPQSKPHRIPILINLITGEWTNDLQSPFAKHSPAVAMLTALHAFYGSELNNI